MMGEGLVLWDGDVLPNGIGRQVEIDRLIPVAITLVKSSHFKNHPFQRSICSISLKIMTHGDNYWNRRVRFRYVTHL